MIDILSILESIKISKIPESRSFQPLLNIWMDFLVQSVIIYKQAANLDKHHHSWLCCVYNFALEALTCGVINLLSR